MRVPFKEDSGTAAPSFRNSVRTTDPVFVEANVTVAMVKSLPLDRGPQSQEGMDTVKEAVELSAVS